MTGESKWPTDADVDEIVTRLYRRFKEWCKRGFGPDDVTWCEVKADVVAMHAAAVAQARAEALSGLKDALEEEVSTQQTDWHDECQAYGVDPNCYGAGFHAGRVNGLERALDLITTPTPEASDGK